MKQFVLMLTAACLFWDSSQTALAQGNFINLNFDSPLPPLTRDPEFMVPTTKALPGWIGYINGRQVDTIVYNTVSLEAPAITLQGPGSSFTPIQGSYSALLQGQFPGSSTGASSAIGQVGQIPLDANSLLFFSGSDSMQVTFAGQSIPLVQLGGTSRYLILGGDISVFAGQTGELRFTQPSVTFNFNRAYLDNIIFSTNPIPEPRVFRLIVFGALLYGIFCRRISRTNETHFYNF